MAHLYLADQKQTRKNSLDKLQGKAGQPSDSTIRDKKADQSWGDSMGGLLKFISWVGRYRIYRIGKYRPISALNAWGHLIGKLAFGMSSKIQRRTKASLRALYPKATAAQIQKMCDTHVKYMGMFFLDIVFRMPFIVDGKPGEAVPVLDYVNFDVLDKKLENKEGAIVPILHIGEHFHNPGGVFLHPKKYKMSVVASVKNLPMYEFSNRAHFTNLYIYASTKFSQISDRLENDLKNNATLVMYHDYSSRRQLRVPFITGQLPFLINTPQSYIRLHRLTGAPILPLITIPDGIFGKSKLFFLDNTSIMEVSKKYWDAPPEVFHGEVSTEINRVMYPWIRKFAPWWEELMRVAGLRAKDELKFAANTSLAQMGRNMQEKMVNILENSYESGRNTEELKVWVASEWPKVLGGLLRPGQSVRDHKFKIDLSIMTSLQELQKMALIMAKELRLAGENEARKICLKFYRGLANFYPIA